MKLPLTTLALSFTLFPLFASETSAPYDISSPAHKVYAFETTDDTSEFTTDKNATITLDNQTFREGIQSLKWTWNSSDSVLTFTNNDAFKNLTGENADPIVYEWITGTNLSVFSIWVYNEKPLQDVVWFEFGKGDRTDTRCWMTLDFAGWQKLDFVYGRDLAKLPNQKDANCMRIIPPKSLEKGSLNFDVFSPRSEVDVRRMTRTEQAPWVHNKSLEVDKLDPFEYLKDKKKFLSKVVEEEITITSKMTEQDRRDIEMMQHRFLKQFQVDWGNKPVSNEMIATIKENCKKRNLIRDPETGFMSGILDRKSTRTFWIEAQAIVSAYHRSTDEEQKKFLLDTFFLYSDLVAQRGHTIGYGLRTIFCSPILEMREEIIQHGKWKQLLEQYRQRTGLHEIYYKNAEANADDYNTRLRSILFFILVDTDISQVYKDLCALKHYMETTARNGEIKPDGSMNHHEQYYTGYSIPAIEPIVDYCTLTYGTSFFNDTMHLYIRRIVYSHYYMSAALEFPRTLSGRWAGSSLVFKPGFSEVFRKLAFMKNPEKEASYVSRIPQTEESNQDASKYPISDHFDYEMASIYLRFCEYADIKNKWVKKFKSMGIKPDNLSGNLSVNYAVANTHRREDWMVFIRGQRAPMLSGENYAGATNDPGRYMNYGYMEVISNGEPYANITSSTWNSPNSPKDFPSNGWNYNFYPGTTVHELPHSALRSHFIIDLRTTSTIFAGSTALNGNGVFGMHLIENLPAEQDPTHIGPVKYWLGKDEYNTRIKNARYDTKFKAKKSYFCFDNRIVCLGSDIQNSDPESSVCTTLFQHVLSPEDQKELGVSTANNQSSISEAQCLFDKNGTAYYLPKGNDRLEFSREHRKLPYFKEWRYPHFFYDARYPNTSNETIPNEGYTELALLRHGANIKNKGYEYCVIVRPDKSKLDQFTKQMQDSDTAIYEVLQKNNQAHVLKDKPSKTIAYVIFEEGDINQGHLLTSNAPCMMMIQDIADDKIELSIHDPRISGDHSDLEFTEITLTIKGNWDGKADCLKKIIQQNGTTTLTIHLHDLLRKSFSLNKLQ